MATYNTAGQWADIKALIDANTGEGKVFRSSDFTSAPEGYQSKLGGSAISAYVPTMLQLDAGVLNQTFNTEQGNRLRDAQSILNRSNFNTTGTYNSQGGIATNKENLIVSFVTDKAKLDSLGNSATAADIKNFNDKYVDFLTALDVSRGTITGDQGLNIITAYKAQSEYDKANYNLKNTQTNIQQLTDLEKSLPPSAGLNYVDPKQYTVTDTNSIYWGLKKEDLQNILNQKKSELVNYQTRLDNFGKQLAPVLNSVKSITANPSNLSSAPIFKQTTWATTPASINTNNLTGIATGTPVSLSTINNLTDTPMPLSTINKLTGIRNIDSLLADQQRTLDFLNQNANDTTKTSQVATAKSFLDSINSDISRSDPSKVKTFTGTGSNSALGTSGTSALGTSGTSALGTGNISALGTGSTSALGTGNISALGTGSISALGTGGTSALGTGSISALGTGSIPALTTADLDSWGKSLPQGITSDQLKTALEGQQTALTSQNANFLKDWNTSADALKTSILSGVDTKNQQFGTQATQGFMDAFKNFQIPTNQQTGVNLGNYNDNRNAAADQWWSQYVTGRR